MSYEISHQNEIVSPGKYSKLDNDDYRLLLEETSLDGDSHVKSATGDQRLQTKINKNGTSEEATQPNYESKSVQTTNKPETKSPSSHSRKSDARNFATKPPSHNLLERSIVSFMRFLSFRRKKHTPKGAENSSVAHEKQYNTLTKRKNSKKDKNGLGSNESSKEQKDDTVFGRFVRTFSFLYKRNPNATNNFKRSQSVQNYRQSRSLPNIKYSPNHVVSTPNSIASSGRNRYNNTTSPVSRHNIGQSEQGGTKRDRARSEVHMPNRSTHVIQTVTSNVPVELKEEKSGPKASLEGCNFRSESTCEDGKMVALDAIQPATLNARLKHLVSSGMETPAVCGIQNHGNTCFINSVIQCLSNTDLLAEYFACNYYQEDLERNKLVSKKYGTRGELTEHLAILLKSLWSCMYSSDISMKFKKVISKYSDQYNGYEQQDAQEFLLWLLDKCHEDLTVQFAPKNGENTLNTFTSFNRKNSKKFIESANDNDEAAANESLAAYHTMNANSIIYDLFQGQLRSMVVCRNCNHYSKTFDPYLCISLPVPSRKTLTIFIQVLFHDPANLSGMYGISIKAAATLRELRDKVSRMLKIPEKRLLLLHIDKHDGMVEFTNDADMIQDMFEDFVTINALETPAVVEQSQVVSPQADPHNLNTNSVQPNEPFSSNSMYHQMITLVWVNRLGFSSDDFIFGPPFSTVVSREVTFRHLQSLILSTMSDYLIEQQNADCDKISHNINLRFRIINGHIGNEYLSSDLNHPLFVASVESALAKIENLRSYRGPYHLKLIVEWDHTTRHKILVDDDLIETIYVRKSNYIDKSVELAKEFSNLNNRTTLQDCLDIYFREESLSAENAWMCPMCNSRQQCVKQLSVWTLPNILIIHLKRLSYTSNVRRLKINTKVEYPQNGLDMLKYVAQRKFDTSDDLFNQTPTSISTGRNNFVQKRMLKNSIETTYNLYGVCCHHGTMQGGHYTAFCKNPVDGCWYLFDDTKVSPLMEEEVVTANAYLLFYQKSAQPVVSQVETKINPSTLSISSGYLSSSNTCSSYNYNHWSFQMPAFNYYNGSSTPVTAFNNNGSNTLPNRKAVNSSKANGVVPHLSQHQGDNFHSISNQAGHRGSKWTTVEANEHSNGGSHVQLYQNGIKGNKYELPISKKIPSRNISSTANHTFPRIKSRKI